MKYISDNDRKKRGGLSKFRVINVGQILERFGTQGPGREGGCPKGLSPMCSQKGFDKEKIGGKILGFREMLAEGERRK